MFCFTCDRSLTSVAKTDVLSERLEMVTVQTVNDSVVVFMDAAVRRRRGLLFSWVEMRHHVREQIVQLHADVKHVQQSITQFHTRARLSTGAATTPLASCYVSN